MKGSSVLSLVAVASLSAPVFSQECRLDYGREDLSELRLSDGYRLAYLAYGSGEPLVLIHGVLSDYRDWQHLVEDLHGDYRVIAPSLRASFPNSMSQSPNTPAADMWSDAGDVIELIERLAVGRVHLVGHSLGAAIALDIAVRRPDLLRTLVLEEPASVEGERSPEIQSLFASVIEQISRGETTAATRDFLNFVSGPGYFDSQSVECQRMLTQNVATLSIGQLPPRTTCADAGMVQTPILYVTGERSPRRNSPLKACLPEHDSVTISDASHGAHSDNPREYSEEVRDFISRYSIKAQEVLDLSYGRAEAKTVVVNDTEFTYVVRGAGSPVVFVHGQLSDFRFWQTIVEEASDRHLVVTYSRRYFFPNPSSRSLPRFQEPTDVPDLIAFIEALGIAPVHLVGHSSGGHAALLATIRRPDLVRSLVLAEGGFLAVPGVENGIAASRAARALLEAGEDEEAVRTFIDATSGPGAFDRMTEVDRQANLDNRMALGLPISPPPSCEEVGSIVIPTMIVRADSSPAFLSALMNALSACLPAAEQVTIPHSSHAMFLDNPEAFNAAVLRFIDDNDR